MASIGDTNISNLVGLGADAMTNMYEVRLDPPIALSADAATYESMVFRVSAFQPPEASQETYDIHWKTVSLKKPKPKISLERSFDLEFRVDAFYRVYEELKKWENAYHNAASGYASGNLGPNLTGTVTIKALSVPVQSVDQANLFQASDPVQVWQYQDVWVEKVTEPSYSTDSAEPIKSTVTFNFGKFIDPAGKLAGYTL